MDLVHPLDLLHCFGEIERVDVPYELCPVAIPPLVVMGPIVRLVVPSDARLMEVVGGVGGVNDPWAGGKKVGIIPPLIVFLPVHTEGEEVSKLGSSWLSIAQRG